MFRKATGKKRPNKAILRTQGRDEDDDEEGGGGGDSGVARESLSKKGPARRTTNRLTANQQQQQQPRGNTSVAACLVAFQEEEPEEGDATNSILPSKKRRGLGYGGGEGGGTPSTSILPKAATTTASNRDKKGDWDRYGQQQQPASSYDLDTLSKLQSEQKRYVVPPTTSEDKNGSNKKDSTGDPMVASGTSFDEGASDPWEAQVTRRAGISGDDPPPPLATTGSSNGAAGSADAGAKLFSMQQVRNQAETTLEQQQQRIHDFNATLRRRESQLTDLHTELKLQESQTQQSGEAVEYYQVLRQKLVAWVGALRQLQSRVIPIQQAMHEVEASMTSIQQQRSWEDDMITVLFQSNRLEQVLGRQPDPSLFDPVSTATTDEFGRDVKSQEGIQREQRARQRQRVRQQREEPLRGDETDVFLTDGEKETLRERHNALLQALQVAKDELDPEYISLQNIVNVFGEWRTGFPDDYDQCYAGLSLADLATVLVQAELCSLNDPWNESQGYNEGKWIAVVHSAHTVQSPSVLDKAAVERIMEKAVYPSVCDLLSKNGYDLVSNRQSRSLSNFCRHVRKIAEDSSPILAKLRSRLIEYMSRYLNDIAIPIVKAESGGDNDSDQPQSKEAMDELEEVVYGATEGLMLRIKKILINLLVHWGPILGHDDAFAELVLDFTSNKFMFLLSSLQQHRMVKLPTNLLLSESPANAFGAVHTALVGTGWLNDAKWMLQAAPIRAAATAYSNTGQ